MQRYKGLRWLSTNKAIVGACRKGTRSIVHSSINGNFYVMHVSIWVGGRKGTFNCEFTGTPPFKLGERNLKIK
jgi:hypothetical protein